nr:MAG TPA: hypothetical protein [Caudoviricetes sp.]
MVVRTIYKYSKASVRIRYIVHKFKTYEYRNT